MPWPEIIAEISRAPYGTEFEYARSSLPSPTDYGAKRGLSVPRGQEASFRFPPSSDGSGVHVLAYTTTYRVHRDRVHPDVSLLGHFFADVVRAPRLPVRIRKTL